jgi:NAD(P)-dependent dehydrogenase (short-subunit alcohol dehydrogenase family)
MTETLSGRVAVVTGAARGIGDAIAARIVDGAGPCQASRTRHPGCRHLPQAER